MDNPQKPIAIVGIAVEIPSGHSAETNLNHDAFFDFLLSKKQAYQEFPSERFGADLYSGRNLGQTITTVGTFLKDTQLFDPAEFGITAKDAKAMALGTRKLIETTFLALLDSGIDYRGRNVGAYMSAVAVDTLSMARADVYDPRGSFAGYPYMVANKVSYHLDLLGPSVPVDTACSSTMTALHIAVQAIRAGDCESAVVGGCQLNHRFIDFVQYSQGSVLAPDGKCKPFDASANGFSRGEGVGAIVLKPLEDAIRDGDHIYASVLGTGINSAGSAAPVSAPVAEAQKAAMHRAYAGTGRLPKEVDYIELHATGTAVGDPVEANWAGAEFRREGELLVGSVKGNIGHLEIMSFLASLSKVCSMFRSGTIPPTVNIQTLNPAIRWEEHGMRVPVEPTLLKARHPSGKALISISSSGIGGVNGHAVLEGPPALQASEKPDVPAHFPVLLVAAGLSPRSASEISETLVAAMSPADPKNLHALSRVYGRRSRQMTWRSAAVYNPTQGPTAFPAPRHSSRKKKPVVFVFPGQGPQHMQMGREFFKYYTPFRESIQRMDQIYAEYTGASLIEQTGLFADVKSPIMQLPEIWPISITLPALAMLQMALCDLFAAVGIVPDAVIGHSAGETAMLYASGAASQTVALELAIARGIAMSYVEGDGSMAAVSCSPSDAQDLIEEVLQGKDSRVLEVACYNAREAVTLAGTTALVDAAVALAFRRGIFARKLRTDVPVHSSLMEGCREQYQDHVGAVFDGDHGLLRPRIRTYSALTGKLWQDQFSAEYFWSNTRLPVMFSQAMDELVAEIPNACFLEICPHPTLGSYIQSIDASLPVISPLKRVKVSEEFDEVQTFLSALGRLIVEGSNGVNFSMLAPHSDAATKISLPPYPFARKSVAYLPDVSEEGEKRNGPLNGPRIGLNSLTHPALAQHVIRNEPIMPAAGFIEIAFEFGAKYLWNVQFESIMPLFTERMLRAQVLQDGHHWSVRSWKSGPEAHNALGIEPTRLHAQGYMSPMIPSSSDVNDLDIDAIRRRCTKLDMEGFYEKMIYFAQFGKAYQRVTGCYLSDSEGLLRIRASVEDIADEGSYRFNPIVLDSCIHALVHPAFTRNLDQSVYYLPASVRTVTLHKSFNHERLPSTLYAYARLREWEPESMTWDLSITDTNGSRLCTLNGLRVALHQISSPLRAETHFKLVYQAKANQQHRGDFDAFPSIAAAQEIGASLSIFHKMLRRIIDVDRKQVVRVLILNFGQGDVNPGFYRSAEDTLIDYTVGTPQAGSTVTAENVRRIAFDPDVPVLDYKSTFDVILALNIAATSRPGDPAKFMEILNHCLHPGGYVVVRQFADDSESPLQSASFWHQASLHASFLGVELHPCVATDSTSFVLAAQKPTWPALPWNSPSAERPTVIEFALDDVLLHQQLIREYEGPTLWISATSGVEGGAALGFARSLRREMHSTAVFLVIFDPIWIPPTRISIIADLATNGDVEEEILIDADGHALVPRLVRASAKAVLPELDQKQYWQLKSGAIFVEPSPLVPDRSVFVRVTNLSFTFGRLQGFSGVISDAGTTSWTRESRVVGVVVSDLISNHFLVHEAQIVAAPDGVAEQLAVCAVPLVILALALGPDSLRTPDRLRGRRFLVTNVEEQIGQSLAALLSALGLKVEKFTGASTDIPLSTIQDSDVIFSGYLSAEDIQVVESTMDSCASVVWWNGPTLARQIQTNPWVVSDALSALHHLDLTRMRDVGLTSPTPDAYLALTSPSPLTLRTPVFKHHRSYLLIGGVGSLGLSIALWMYENGARHIVLTSRSGEGSLARDRNTPAIRLLAYLRTRPDLKLRLEACDAASPVATAALVRTIEPPLAGCMLLAVIFSDRAFVSHTTDTFYVPFTGKTGALKALEEAVTIPSLDFLVALSSVTGLFGSPGQTNYAGANTAVDALIQTYPNAISIVAPAILNSNFLVDQKNISSDSRFKMWTAWGVTSRHLCDCIEDAIREMNHTTSSRMYLPDVDWEGLQSQLGDSPMYGHFLKGPDASAEALSGASKSSVLDTVRQMAVQVLDVDPKEFDVDVPFTSYGLDSLSAGRFAFMLKPYLSITQVQLLSDLCLADVYQKIELSQQTMATDQQSGGVDGVDKGRFNWSAMNQPGQTVVALVEGEGNPLIVIHGTSGNIVALIPLQERFNSPLWAIQTTPETPLDSMEAMTLFYFQQIKARRPVGPYRLAAFSGISLIVAQLALHFERNGDHVVQLAMIDHFPTLFALPELLPLDTDTVAGYAPSQTLILAEFDQLFDLYGRDPSPTRQVIEQHLRNVLAGLPVPDSIRAYHQVFVKILTMIVRFVLDLPDDGTGRAASFEAWMRQVQAPVTVFVADNGMTPSIEAGAGWEDLGARKCLPDAQVTFVTSGHFTSLETDEVVDGLEHGW
ncbi:putative polyketide synthase [Mycena alexandri]|uniref:Polyketide synthase n=1 Tax=Mycena alexandri TaxID=1745969 RepID=A0AAD6TJH0_9AGAR|nr:putative polyketide synthase [Mycena alexandri]